jgi:hypothetical protein
MSLINNQSGTLSFIGIACVISLKAYLFLSLANSISHRKILIGTFKNSICSKVVLLKTKKYLHSIASSNKKIVILTPLLISPKTRLLASKTIKLIKKAQYLKTLKLLSFPFRNRKCSSSNVLATIPYKLRGYDLIRNKDQTAKLTKLNASITVSSKINMIEINSYKVKIASRFSTNFKLVSAL